MAERGRRADLAGLHVAYSQVVVRSHFEDGGAEALGAWRALAKLLGASSESRRFTGHVASGEPSDFADAVRDFGLPAMARTLPAQEGVGDVGSSRNP